MIAIKSQIESVFIPQFEYLVNNNRSCRERVGGSLYRDLQQIVKLRRIKEKTRLRVFTLKKII